LSSVVPHRRTSAAGHDQPGAFPGHTLLDLAAFRREAATILDLPVDVATLDMLKDRIRNEVAQQALPI
jgi:predicted nucleotidyltransferase